MVGVMTGGCRHKRGCTWSAVLRLSTVGARLGYVASGGGAFAGGLLSVFLGIATKAPITVTAAVDARTTKSAFCGAFNRVRSDVASLACWRFTALKRRKNNGVSRTQTSASFLTVLLMWAGRLAGIDIGSVRR